jgi:hypothetical protein
MKWRVTALTVITIALGAFLVWGRWDVSQNRGYTFGYWGQFNRVGNALSENPDITVTDSGKNEDITLEESFYNVKTADGRELSLWFAERDPIRKMTGSRLTEALLKKIEAESSKSRTANKGD